MSDQQSDHPVNPFDPTLADAPFAGRSTARQRITQHLMDPVGQPVPTFIGRPRIGKTALLRQYVGLGPDYFGVYLPMQNWSPEDDANLLAWLMERLLTALNAHELTTLTLEPPQQADFSTLQTWFMEEALPSVFRVIRRRRTLILLLDDADALHRTVKDSTARKATLQALHDLLQPQLGIVLTVDSDYEDTLSTFTPLVAPENVLRLTNLKEDETHAVLTTHLPVDQTVSAAVYRATGGIPALVQRFGYFLHDRLPAQLAESDVNEITQSVYQEHETTFKGAWHNGTRDERLVLTALSSLLYDDPLKPVTPEKVERWLVETDFPLDDTAINAAVRGLAYRELIQVESGQITISAGLMQTWLLDNARLSEPGQNAGAQRWRTIGIAVLIVIALGIILAVALSSEPQSEGTPAIPTAELQMTPDS